MIRHQLPNLAYPIIQAPMAGNILTPELVAAVSNAGMLGSIASGYLSRGALEEFILAVKQLTSKPFVVNIFIEPERETSPILLKPQSIIDLERQIGMPYEPDFTLPATISQDEYVSLLLKHNIPIASCTFGLFSSNNMLRLKKQAVVVIANATNLAEVHAADQSGADAIILQGVEAGGHQASFINEHCNQLTSLELLNQVRSLNLATPLIVTGGVNCANLMQFIAAGANYVQLGTLFMLSDLSNLALAQQQYLITGGHNSTVLSPMLTGKWVRGINNQLMRQLDSCDYPFPIQHYATAKLRSFARKHGLFDYTGSWLGQHASYAIRSTSELLQQLINCYMTDSNGIKHGD